MPARIVNQIRAGHAPTLPLHEIVHMAKAQNLFHNLLGSTPQTEPVWYPPSSDGQGGLGPLRPGAHPLAGLHPAVHSLINELLGQHMFNKLPPVNVPPQEGDHAGNPGHIGPPMAPGGDAAGEYIGAVLGGMYPPGIFGGGITTGSGISNRVPLLFGGRR